MTNIACSICQTSLTGGLEIYGDVNEELCWSCYSEHAGREESWYGLAPHHHDLNQTGSYIGSTVFDPLPEPNENGEYEIDGLRFRPDAEDFKCGIWTRIKPKGWM